MTKKYGSNITDIHTTHYNDNAVERYRWNPFQRDLGTDKRLKANQKPLNFRHYVPSHEERLPVLLVSVDGYIVIDISL